MIDENKKKVLELFAEGRRNYKLMEFSKALQYFSDALRVDPNDGPSKVYYLRCKHYIENPPPEDWDGVFVMTTK
ncbi:tetratricopeptide repeat protein [Gracilinema caldarium]|uniref:tetratricopeptide repeat protein n=1 Tax=Gracilinema caldarium TaxID=215591 RepID=UPI0026F091A1|nr:tetratricopeptide repeat protein [Gracilinema caldarium]MCA1949099.1 tetratricopeptide repeat protein [Treponema sp.]